MYRNLRIFVIAATAATLLGCSDRYGPSDLVGTWDGSSHDMPSIVVIFSPDGRFRMEYSDAQGEIHEVDGTYETDFKKSPIPLSIRNIPQLPHPLHTLVEFYDQNTIRMGSFASRWRLRPISFNPETEKTLTRRQDDEVAGASVN